MTKLSLIDDEARRLAGRFPEARRRALQGTLIELCEAHWQAIRGTEPSTSLAHALWSVTPPLADLFVDMHAAGDARAVELPDGLKPARALALLVLAEIERGDAEGIRIAHHAMMAFESPAAGRVHAGRVAAALHGGLSEARLPRAITRTPLGHALAIIVARTARHDLRACIEVIRLLAAAPASTAPRPDEKLEQLRDALHETGVRFLKVDDEALHFELHGREHKPLRLNRLRDTLAAIREAWVA
jgi:hypothetical protein